MNTENLQPQANLDVLFPEARTVSFVRQGAESPETVQIYALPLNKWKKGFWYIAQVAPMLGFDLFGGAISAEQAKITSGTELFDAAEKIAEGNLIADNIDGLADGSITASLAPTPVDTQAITTALMGDGGDLILEFLAFAIDKKDANGNPDTSFFDGMYDEIVDIAVAVIELNLNFFVQKLLPKIVTGSKGVVATVRNVKASIQK